MRVCVCSICVYVCMCVHDHRVRFLIEPLSAHELFSSALSKNSPLGIFFTIQPIPFVAKFTKINLNPKCILRF